MFGGLSCAVETLFSRASVGQHSQEELFAPGSQWNSFFPFSFFPSAFFDAWQRWHRVSPGEMLNGPVQSSVN